MAKRCKICEGQLVNGRCKSCGMFYRSDDEMYHLNETRRVHYQHASKKVKNIIAQQEAILSDWKQEDYSKENPNAEQSLASILKKSAGSQKKKQNSYSGKQKASAEKQAGSSSFMKKKFEDMPFIQKERKKDAEKVVQIKKDSVNTDPFGRKKAAIIKAGILAVILFSLLSFVQSWISEFRMRENITWNEVDEEITWEEVEQEETAPDEFWSEEVEYKSLEEAISETEENSFLSSFYMLHQDAQTLIEDQTAFCTLVPDEVKSDFEPGYYMAVIQKSFGRFHIFGEYGSEHSDLSRYNNYLVFELGEGESIELLEAGSPEAEVWIYQINVPF